MDSAAVRQIFDRSAATYVVVERLSDESRERMRAEVVEALQPLREERGFPRSYIAVFTRAGRGG